MEYSVKNTFCLALIGLPGAGKTTLAESLIKRIVGLRIVSRDRVRGAMFDPCTFSNVEKDAAFQALRLAQEAIWQRPESTVADGICFSDANMLDCVVDDATRYGIQLIAVNCQCPLEIAIDRVEADRRLGSHSAKDRDAALVRRVKERFFDVPTIFPSIDMTQTPLRVTEDMLEILSSAGTILK